MGAMREPLEHAHRVEVPHRRARHNVHPKRAKDGKVHGGIGLLHEAVLLCARPNSEVDRQGPDEALHEQLTREGQHDNVEGHKGKVSPTFAIVLRSCGVLTDGERN